MFRGVWSLGGRTKTGRMYRFPVKREYQYFLNRKQALCMNQEKKINYMISFLLVHAAEYKVEYYEE